MYEEGRWQDDYKICYIITRSNTRSATKSLPKKNIALIYSDFRIISLLCHALKIMLKVLTKRLEVKAKKLAKTKTVSIQKRMWNYGRNRSDEKNMR